MICPDKAATIDRGQCCMPLTIDISDERPTGAIDHRRLKRAVRQVLADAGIHTAEISIAVVNDARMQELNRQYLAHDHPTDVLSFVLERDERAKSLDGEIIISADYAAREAVRYGWTAADELLLYVIHGVLHLVGHDDIAPSGRKAMRAAETKYLGQFGLTHRFDRDA